MAKSVKLLCAALAVAFAYGAVAWYVGGRIEAQWHAGHQRFSEVTGLSAESVDYRRGLFASEAITLLRPWRGADAPSVALSHTIYHGPLPRLREGGLATIVSEWQPSAAWREALRGSLGDQTPATLHTRLGYRGDGRLELTLLGFRAHLARGEVWRVEPGQLEWTFGPQLRRYATTLDWGGLEWRGSNGTWLQLHGLQGRDAFEVPQGRRHGFVGSGRYEAVQIALSHGAGPGRRGAAAPTAPTVATVGAGEALRLAQPVVQLQATADGEQLDTVLQAQAERLHLQGMELGPARVALALRQLHLPTFEQFYPRLSALLAQAHPQQAYAALPPAEQQVLRDQAAALLAQGLHLSVEDGWLQAPQGPVQWEASARAPALTGTDLAFLPLSLLPRLQLDLALQLPQSLAAQWLAPKPLARLLAQGLVQRDGDRLVARLAYQGGYTTLNSRMFELALLEQLLR